MLRTSRKLQALVPSHVNAFGLRHGARVVGTRLLSSAAPDAEGEPSFLEMVNLFVENARELALQRLTTKPPPPGRRQDPPDQKRAFVKGNYLLHHFNGQLCFGSIFKVN